MFINSIDLNTSKIDADICIVGAGVAGISIAREFKNTNSKIVVLESGSFEPKSEAQSLNSGYNIGLPYYNLKETRRRAFGGSSHCWEVHDRNNNSYERVRLRDMDAIDFEKREWVPYSGWPFSKEALAPFYECAHELFELGPYKYSVDYWGNSPENREMKFTDGAVGTIMFQFGRNDIFFDQCKQELADVENIEVYLNTTALKLKINEYSNRINSIIATSGRGDEFRVEAQCFILALGGLENPRLLLLSNDQVRKGIGNQNDLVGRFFMEHPHLWSGVFYPSDPSFFKKSKLYNIHFVDGTPVMGKLRLSDEVMKEERILNNVVSLHLSPMHAIRQQILEIHEVLQSIRERKMKKSLLSNLKNIFSNPLLSIDASAKKITGDVKFRPEKRYHGFLLNMMSEQIPNPESRVNLSRKRDRFGQNKLELNWKLTSSDIRSIRRFQEILNREMQKSSLGYLDIELEDDRIPDSIHGGHHHMGTTRMHSDPNTGVVDKNCRVHGVDNLFIAGSSVFPTGGFANPTLTIIALALRLADHVKDNFGNIDSYRGRVQQNKLFDCFFTPKVKE